MVGVVVRFFALILVLIVSAATAVSAAEARKQASLPSFEFRGHRIGEPIEQNFPYWAEGVRGAFLPFCARHNIIGIYSCNDPTIEVDDWVAGRAIGKKLVVGDVPVLGLHYIFLDNHLSGVEMVFDIKVYLRIFGMLNGKYGPPQSEKIEPFQDGEGVRFRTVVSDWAFKEGVLRLYMRFSNARTSHLSFVNPKAKVEMARREQEQNLVKGKQAF